VSLRRPISNSRAQVTSPLSTNASCRVPVSMTALAGAVSTSAPSVWI
jgi:hypothetical protein